MHPSLQPFLNDSHEERIVSFKERTSILNR